MRKTFEISDRFIEAGDANELLYEPLGGDLTFRRTRRYEIDFEGEENNLVSFVEKTLRDPISQDLKKGEDSAFTAFAFVLEYGIIWSTVGDSLGVFGELWGCVWRIV